MKSDEAPSPTIIFIGAIFFTLMLGVVDWQSGYELQFFVFYFLPVAAVASSCGSARTWLIVGLSSITWFMADWTSGHQYSCILYPIWNTAIRVVSFSILAYTILRITALLERERKISADLQKALAEVKTLKGLLPVCAWCKKIRNDKGYWLQLEEYIEKNSDAQFTHGVCQACADKILKHNGINLSDIEPNLDGHENPPL